jgi:hypothetical protein
MDKFSREMAMTKKAIRPVRFTPDNILLVRQLAAEGNSSIEIARSLGSTASKTYVAATKSKYRASGNP